MLEGSIGIQDDLDNLWKCPKTMVKFFKVSTKFPTKKGLVNCVNAG